MIVGQSPAELYGTQEMTNLIEQASDLLNSLLAEVRSLLTCLPR